MRWLFFLLLPLQLLFAGELKKTEIQLGSERVTVEIADTPAAHAKGLMGRTHLPDNEGMLFVFERPSILSFWMKNTLIPLSIGFFDHEKKLINTAEMEPGLSASASSLPRYKSQNPAVFALEMPKGWFSNNQIGPGEKFSFLDPGK